MDKKLERQCLRIAQNLAPKDTGNLAFNSISIRDSNEFGFTILYSGRDAYYNKFVEEGTEFQKAQKYVAKTRLAIAIFVKDYLEGDGKKHKSMYKRDYFDNKKTQERQFTRMKSLQKSITK